MATISKFEDIEAWRKGRELTRLVYRLSARGNFARDFALRDQMRRAAVSVLSNIGEGFERGGDKEFRQFLALAKGSTGELKAQLYVALDAGFLSQAEFDEAYAIATDTGRLIAGFMRYLGKSAVTGIKYRGIREEQIAFGEPSTGDPLGTIQHQTSGTFDERSQVGE